jgi:hypothetical protein
MRVTARKSCLPFTSSASGPMTLDFDALIGGLTFLCAGRFPCAAKDRGRNDPAAAFRSYVQTKVDDDRCAKSRKTGAFKAATTSQSDTSNHGQQFGSGISNLCQTFL